jgi:hypothetical protein
VITITLTLLLRLFVRNTFNGIMDGIEWEGISRRCEINIFDNGIVYASREWEAVMSQVT